MVICVLQDIAIEAVFPQSAICRVWDDTLNYNKYVSSMLQNGTLYRTGRSTFSSKDRCYLICGSRPEGLALEDEWGHAKPDTDFMKLFGIRLGVHVPRGQQPQGESCLEFCPKDCPVTYTKLRVTDLHSLQQYWASESWPEECFHRSGKKDWLDTSEVVLVMRHRNSIVNGPAAHSDNRDMVFTFICNSPHPELQQDFLNRPRQWPPAPLIFVLLQLPMLLVPVGHKPSSEFKLQARISWSHLELKLIQELPKRVCQGYIAFKYTLKRFLEHHRGLNEACDGRNCVGSYHLKTLFLRYLEETPPSMITSPFALFLGLLHELDKNLRLGVLPHYFLHQCNLLETVDCDERCITLQAIEEIIADPLNALLTSPIDLNQIYGEVHPDSLVGAFKGVSIHPTCQQSQKYLSDLLASLDQVRKQRFRKQRECDKSQGISGRAELTVLVDSLQRVQFKYFPITLVELKSPVVLCRPRV